MNRKKMIIIFISIIALVLVVFFAMSSRIRVYPVGADNNNNGCAYIVKGGKIWFCNNTDAYRVTLH
jgi:hypothetical protein